MAEGEQTPTGLKAQLAQDITKQMLERREGADGKPTGQPINVPAWGVIFGELKSRGATDAEITRNISETIKQHALAHDGGAILEGKINSENATPEQKDALLGIKQQEADTLDYLTGIVAQSLEDPQVRERLQSAILSNAANADPKMRGGVQGLFDAYAQVQALGTAPPLPQVAAQPSVAPNATPTVPVTPPAATTSSSEKPTMILPERNPPPETWSMPGLALGAAAVTGVAAVKYYWGGLTQSGREMSQMIAVEFRKNMGEKGYNFTPKSSLGEGRFGGSEETPVTKTTPVPSTGTAESSPQPNNGPSTAGRTSAQPPAATGPTVSGTGSGVSSAAGAAEVVTAESSLFSRGLGWGKRLLGNAAVPLTVLLTGYEAMGDVNQGNYRGATSKVVGGATALGTGVAGAALGTMLFPGVGTVAGFFIGAGFGAVAGTAGYFAGEWGGEKAYDAVVGPPTASETKPGAPKETKPSDTDPSQPNGLENTKKDALTWGTVLGATATAAMRKSGWGRLGTVVAGATLTGAAIGSKMGYDKDEQAVVDRAAAATTTPPGAATSNKPAAKGNIKTSPDDKDSPLAGEENDWIKKIGKFLVAILSALGATGIAKMLGEFLGVSDESKTAAGALAGGAKKDGINPAAMGVALAVVPAGNKNAMITAPQGSHEEMQEMMWLITQPGNERVLERFGGTMRAHAFKNFTQLGSFSEFGDLAKKAQQGDTAAKDVLPGKLLEIMAKNPELKNELNKEIIPMLRDQHHTLVAAHNAALPSSQGKTAVAKTESASSAPVPQEPGVQSVNTVGGGSTQQSTALPPSRLETQMLLTEIGRPGNEALQGKLDDAVSKHGISAWRKGDEGTFTDYLTAKSSGDKAGMSEALLALVEKFPDFRKDLYRDVVPGMLSPERLQQARALDTLMQPGQEGKLRQFTDMVSQRTQDLNMLGVVGDVPNKQGHIELLEALKRDKEGHPGVRENIPGILAAAAKADPAVEQSLLRLAQSVERQPPVQQVATTSATLTPVNNDKGGEVLVQVKSGAGQQVAAAPDHDSGGSSVGGFFKDFFSRQRDPNRLGVGGHGNQTLAEQLIIASGQSPSPRGSYRHALPTHFSLDIGPSGVNMRNNASHQTSRDPSKLLVIP